MTMGVFQALMLGNRSWQWVFSRGSMQCKRFWRYLTSLGQTEIKLVKL